MKNIPEFRLKHNKKENTLILSASEIDSHASLFLQEFSKSNPEYSIFTPMPTPIEQIIESYCGIPLDFQTFSDQTTLGMTSFSSGFIQIVREGKEVPYHIEKGSIIVSNELAESADDEKLQGRYFYTLAHELGHNVYHRVLFESPDSENQLSLFGEEPKEILAVTCHRDNIENPDNTHGKNWTEWQADYFASCILMPKEAVREFWNPFIAEPDFVFGEEPKPLLSSMNWLERDFQIDEFVKTFKVSYQAARIRLEKLNYIARRQSL